MGSFPIRYAIKQPCDIPFEAREYGYFGGFLHWTPDGERLVFDDDDVITIVDEAGRRVRSVVDANPSGTGLGIHGFYADLSPDGSRIAYSSCEFSQPEIGEYYVDYGRYSDYRPDVAVRNYEIAVIGIDGTNQSRLTVRKGLNHYPAWAPDGSQIMYLSSNAPGLPDYNKWVSYSIIDYNKWVSYSVIVDSRIRSRLYDRLAKYIGLSQARGFTLYPPVWSPNGEDIAAVGTREFVTGRVDETEFTRFDLTTALPVWTPDGREVVYASLDGTVPVVYAAQPDGEGKRPLWRGDEGSSAVPVTHLHWSPDGSRLLIVADGITVMEKDGGNPRQIVASRVGTGALAKWSPDGSRIAVYQRQFFEDEGRRVLLTAHLFSVAPDGSDLRLLAVKKGAMSPLAAASPAGPAGEAADAAACSAGVVVPDPAENPGLVQDCEVLLGMRRALTGPTRADVGDGGGAQPRPLRWDAERPIDQWEGVTVGCSPRRVIGIALPGRELAGAVPPALGRLSELRTIDFGNPEDLFLRDSLAFTGFFTEFPNLLTGALPKELAALPHLRTLKLRNNYLSGPFPEELRGLEGLTTLELDGNNILDAEPDRTPDVSGGVAGPVVCE